MRTTVPARSSDRSVKCPAVEVSTRAHQSPLKVFLQAAAFPVSLDRTDPLAGQASQAAPESPALPDSPAARHQSARRQRRHRAARAHKVHLVSLERRERVDLLEGQASLDVPATMDLPDLRDHRVHLVCCSFVSTQALRNAALIQAHPAILAAMDPRASLDDQRSAHLPFPATQASQESKAHQACANTR